MVHTTPWKLKAILSHLIHKLVAYTVVGDMDQKDFAENLISRIRSVCQASIRERQHAPFLKFNFYCNDWEFDSMIELLQYRCFFTRAKNYKRALYVWSMALRSDDAVIRVDLIGRRYTQSKNVLQPSVC